MPEFMEKNKDPVLTERMLLHSIHHLMATLAHYGGYGKVDVSVTYYEDDTYQTKKHLNAKSRKPPKEKILKTKTKAKIKPKRKAKRTCKTKK